MVFVRMSFVYSVNKRISRKNQAANNKCQTYILTMCWVCVVWKLLSLTQLVATLKIQPTNASNKIHNIKLFYTIFSSLLFFSVSLFALAKNTNQIIFTVYILCSQNNKRICYGAHFAYIYGRSKKIAVGCFAGIFRFTIALFVGCFYIFRFYDRKL